MILISLFLISLILFAVTIVFGFWVRSKGRPYHSALFNVHKLVALTGVVLGALRVRSIYPLKDLPGWTISVLAVVGISIVILFATGAVMSIREDEPGIALLLHRASPVIIVLCLIGVYFLI